MVSLIVAVKGGLSDFITLCFGSENATSGFSIRFSSELINLKKMRRVIALVGGLFFVGFCYAQDVSGYILELEQPTKWEAVDSEWSGRSS